MPNVKNFRIFRPQTLKGFVCQQIFLFLSNVLLIYFTLIAYSFAEFTLLTIGLSVGIATATYSLLIVTEYMSYRKLLQTNDDPYTFLEFVREELYEESFQRFTDFVLTDFRKLCLTVFLVYIHFLNFLDYLTTTVGLHLGAYEANSIMAPVVTSVFFLPVKIGAISLLTLRIMYQARKNENYYISSLFLLILVTFLLSAVIGNNTLVIRRLLSM